MAAPLIAGNDVRTMSAATKEILTNPEVIAVDQDSLGAQGVIVWEPTPDLQVWSKKMRDGSIAVAMLNRSTAPAKIAANFWRAGLHVGSAKVRDLWQHADLGTFKSEYATTVPAHGVVMVRVTPAT
jgi:alpha-galactosidase